MVGGKNSERSKHAWRQVYRALDHGTAKNACKNQEFVSKFPKPVEDFANMFVSLQIKRHDADYDPNKKYTKSEVIQDIDSAEQVIKDFMVAAIKDRRAFSAYGLFKLRL